MRVVNVGNSLSCPRAGGKLQAYPQAGIVPTRFQNGTLPSKRMASWFKIRAHLGMGMVHFWVMRSLARYNNFRAALGEGKAALFLVTLRS